MMLNVRAEKKQFLYFKRAMMYKQLKLINS